MSLLQPRFSTYIRHYRHIAADTLMLFSDAIRLIDIAAIAAP